MKRIGFLSLVTLLAASPAMAQTHSGLPVNVDIALAPTAVVAADQTRLVYELRITNFAPVPFDLSAIRVLSGETVLADYRGAGLEALLEPVGAANTSGHVRTLEPGKSIIAFVDLGLAPGATTPGTIRHELTFSRTGADGSTVERVVTGLALNVQGPAMVVGPPLKGRNWVAANGLFSPDHRRSYNAVDGQEHLAQRFAIDWVQLSPDGRFFHDSNSANGNFYGYGAEVIAVADGVVAAIVNDQPDNQGNNPASGRSPTLDSITGNCIVLDLGGGTFALYAHLQPGSIKVSVGQRVTPGQLLARLGNSGNSDAPHLHFQLMNGNSPLGAEGLPFALRAFTQVGVLSDLALLDSGKPWRGNGIPPRDIRQQFPADKAVIDFPDPAE